MTTAKIPPSVVQGRRGGMSVADALVRALWLKKGTRPERTIAELTKACRETLRYDVAPSTVRSALYNAPDVFEKAKAGNPVYYRLTRAFVDKYAS